MRATSTHNINKDRPFAYIITVFVTRYTGMHGEAGQLAYVELTRTLTHIFVRDAEASSRLPFTSSRLLAHLDEIVMYQMREAFHSRTVKEEMLLFFALYSVPLSKCGPHFDLSRAKDVVVSFIRCELLLENTTSMCDNAINAVVRLY